MGVLHEEVSLDFDQVVSGGGATAGPCCCGIETGEVVGNRKDLVDPALDGVAD